MPTRGRQEYAAKALQCFLSQTLPTKELVVIDDADDLSFPEGIDHPLVHYVVNQQRLGIPHKRNQALRLAKGQIIANFDSDDFSMPTRLEDQVKRLVDEGKPLTGYSGLLFFNEMNRTAWKYTLRAYACGTSMCFWKWWGETHPFREAKAIASDHEVVHQAQKSGELSWAEAGQLMVARIHPGNSAVKKMDSPFIPVSINEIPKEFFA